MPPRRIFGRVIPLPLSNVDTDLIIPARFMKTLGKDGLAQGAFAALRENPDNPFDDSRRRGAPVLVAGANFGCGSSREHAVWALQQLGIEAVIAPSFGEIFEGNALRNGLVPVRLAEEEVERLFRLDPDERLTIDVEAGAVTGPNGWSAAFELDPYRKYCLIEGVDDMDVALSLAEATADYEARISRERPWEQRVEGEIGS